MIGKKSIIKSVKIMYTFIIKGCILRVESDDISKASTTSTKASGHAVLTGSKLWGRTVHQTVTLDHRVLSRFRSRIK